MSLAYRVAQHIQANGIASFPPVNDWGLSVARELEKPVNTVTVYDTGGDGVDTDEVDVYRPTIQVRVRAADYLEGHRKARNVVSLLNRVGNISMDGGSIAAITATSGINAIGEDDNRRFLFTVNFDSLTQED